MRIRAETPGDHGRVRELHARAFADERIPELVDVLRAARRPLAPVSLVAAGEHGVTGHVLLSHSLLDAPRRLVHVYVLSPLAVLPEHQGNGIGTALVEHALAAAGRAGVPLVFLEGSPAYYGKRGFERADEAGFRAPSLRIPPPAFQVHRLPSHEDWMTGTLVYDAAFWDLDCVGLRSPEAG